MRLQRSDVEKEKVLLHYSIYEKLVLRQLESQLFQKQTCTNDTRTSSKHSNGIFNNKEFTLKSLKSTNSVCKGLKKDSICSSKIKLDANSIAITTVKVDNRCKDLRNIKLEYNKLVNNIQVLSEGVIIEKKIFFEHIKKMVILNYYNFLCNYILNLILESEKLGLL